MTHTVKFLLTVKDRLFLPPQHSIQKMESLFSNVSRLTPKEAFNVPHGGFSYPAKYLTGKALALHFFVYGGVRRHSVVIGILRPIRGDTFIGAKTGNLPAIVNNPLCRAIMFNLAHRAFP
jgi:hypothetical protein